MVVHLGLVDFDFYIPSSCPAPQPILPNFHLPKQNEAGSGMPKINVNPTQVHDHLPNPVLIIKLILLISKITEIPKFVDVTHCEGI